MRWYLVAYLSVLGFLDTLGTKSQLAYLCVGIGIGIIVSLLW